MKKQDTRPKSQIEKQTAYAKIRLERGDTCDEIMADSAMEGYNRATLRSLKKRMQGAKSATQAKEKIQTATHMQRSATQESEPMTTQYPQKQPEKAGFASEFARAFHPADLLYYLCVAISVAGIVQTLHLVGCAVAVVFFSVAVLGLHFVKVRTGWARVPHLLLLALGIVGNGCIFVPCFN